MSEVKGQVLGVILVLILFGFLSVCLSTVFDNATTSISGQMNEILEIE